MTRVGLMLPPHGDPADYVDIAVRAEQQGFDFVACGEHVFFGAPMPNAFVALAAVAGVTKNVGLVSAVTILPQYSAPLAAKLAATVDRISHGRFELGVGVGGEYPLEFEATGVPLKGRGRRTDEALQTVVRLLEGQTLRPEPTGGETPLGQLRLDPCAWRQSGPPIWIGGRSDTAIRRAGRFGDWWLPYLVTPSDLHAGLERARSVERWLDRPGVVQGAAFLWSAVHRDRASARAQAVSAVSAIYRQDMSRIPDALLPASDPPGLLERFREYQDAGAQALIFSPACAPHEFVEMVDLFAREVLPFVNGSSFDNVGAPTEQGNP